MRTRPALGLAVAALLTLALTACGGNDSDSAKKSAADEPTSQEAGGPDLAGIPDVVAEVNGEEITKDEFVLLYTAQFKQAELQSQTSGQEPDEETLKKQAADNLVDTELLSQEAESRGISASDEDVDAELAALADQYDLGSTDELLTALEKQGTTADQARDQVETQVLIEKLVTDEKGSVEPTKKEVRDLYDQAKLQQEQMGEAAGEQTVPPFAKVRDQLVERLTSDRIGKGAQVLVKKLRKDADITINL